MASTVPWHGGSLALLTDLYQLTMAYGYWKTGLHRKEAVFHLFFRGNPFGGGYAIAAGLEAANDWIACLRFSDDDRAYLARLRGNDGQPLFEPDFLNYVSDFQFQGDIDAIPEGTAVFAHEPLVRVQGSLLECQLLETALLNLVNFQTLIATKAARVCHAARGDRVIEFGLRRAQGIDGGLSAARAAFVGGCAGTSNVLAGSLFDIPILGTHAHSWVMAHENELAAFRGYAEALPNNCVFLVDTYDTCEGTRHAAEVGRELRARGHEMVGIRLDSGNLESLAKQARAILDDAGLANAAIVASNDLDEHSIDELKRSGAPITIWGVGTRLSTAFDQPALGGVYKLACVREPGQAWRNAIKVSDDPIKSTTPGIQQVRRFRDASSFVADAIFDLASPPGDACTIVDFNDPSRRLTLGAANAFDDLLVPIFRGGRCVYASPALREMRERTRAQLAMLPEGIKRLKEPDQYPVGLELGLFELKERLTSQQRIGGQKSI